MSISINAQATLAQAAEAGIFDETLRRIILEAITENRDDLIDAINERLNVVLLSESIEQRIIAVIYDALLEVAGDVL